MVGIGRRPIGVGPTVEYARGTERGGALRAGISDSPLGQIARIGCRLCRAKGAQHRDIGIGEATAPVGRQVEVEIGAAPDRFVEQLEQALGRLDLGVLIGVVEPAGADRHVGFGGPPQGSAAHAAIALGLDIRVVGHGRPARIARHAILIADPADFGTERIEGAGHGLIFVDQSDRGRPVVISLKSAHRLTRVESYGLCRPKMLLVELQF